MRKRHRYMLAAVIILGSGAARMPVEHALTAELRSSHLLPVQLDLRTREKIDQTRWAVALGGLRTLVATFVHLQAFTAFTERRWADVAELYDTVVNLAPRTPYYWESGGWHLAYNAASYYRHESDLPQLRANAEWRSYVRQGRAFLERGVRNNPDDPKVNAFLGRLLSDPDKIAAFKDPGEAFADAAAAYRRAADSGRALPYVRRAQLYSMARASGLETEALALARELFRASGNDGPPTLLAVLFVLEMRHHSQDPLELALRIFGAPERAYDILGNFWNRTDERFPMDGVAAALGSLETRLLIPPERSVLERRR